MKKNAYSVIAAFAIFILLPGCATVTKGKRQTVTVDTNPSNAVCTMTREGSQIAVVNPTPGSVTVDKSGAPILVECKKDGYLDTEGTVESKFQNMTFGNIILGGVIGAAVDASSGAMHEYEPAITITLIPEAFASVEERDAFFNKMRDDFLVQSGQTMERISKQCDQEECEEELDKAKQAKEIKLAAIETKRQQALIGLGSQRQSNTVTKAQKSVEQKSSFQQDLLKVAILAVRGCGVNKRAAIREQAERVVQQTRHTSLVPGKWSVGSGLGNQKMVWSRQSKPNSEFIYNHAAETDLDALVMISCSSTWIPYMNYIDGEVYVVDLRIRQVLHNSVPQVAGEDVNLDVEKQLHSLLQKASAVERTGDSAKAP